MELYDASVPLRTGMVTFPGDPPFTMSPMFERNRGDAFDLALLSMGTHIGTHVDPRPPTTWTAEQRLIKYPLIRLSERALSSI